MPDLKPELSKKSEYWLPKHRYYELKHYCLQYPEWKHLYSSLYVPFEPFIKYMREGRTLPTRPAERVALILADVKRAMDLVEQCCDDVSEELSPFLLKGVTEGLSYDKLQALYEISYGRDAYYEAYREFFYILSQRKGI